MSNQILCCCVCNVPTNPGRREVHYMIAGDFAGVLCGSAWCAQEWSEGRYNRVYSLSDIRSALGDGPFISSTGGTFR
jgi:hypothetical protein